MEKKGEILNQLATISDLLEKINIKTKSQTLVIEVSQSEFDLIFETVEKKYGKKSEKPKNSFSLTIGFLDIVFNMNNV